MKHIVHAGLLAAALGICSLGSAFAQSANETRGAGGGPDQAGQPETSDKPAAPQTPPPVVISPELSADRRREQPYGLVALDIGEQRVQIRARLPEPASERFPDRRSL